MLGRNFDPLFMSITRPRYWTISITNILFFFFLLLSSSSFLHLTSPSFSS
jgi:hypothetical protein